MSTPNRVRAFLVLFSLALFAAGCGFTSLTVEMTPNPIVVTENTKDVNLNVSFRFNGTGFVTVDEIVLSLRNANGDAVRDPDTLEELVWKKVVEQTVPAFGASVNIDHMLELNYKMVRDLGIDHLHLSVLGSRPTTATSKIILMPEPEE